MSFLAPARLLLFVLVALLVVAYVLLQARSKRFAMRYTNLSLLNEVAPRHPGWRRHVSAMLFLVTLVLLVTGFARPATKVKVPRERATIIVALDVSYSMQAKDVPPSRIKAAKSAAVKFVQELPPRFNVGLVSFAGTATVSVSPSKDHVAVAQAIKQLRLRKSTAIGEAIYTSLRSIRSFDARAKRSPPPSHIVLISDGESQKGRSVSSAVGRAHQLKVPVSTIAYGTQHGYVVLDGKRVPVRVDKATLRGIAQSTDGQFYEAASGTELKAVYQDIGSSLGYKWTEKEVSVQFIGWALLFAFAAAGASTVLYPRLP